MNSTNYIIIESVNLTPEMKAASRGARVSIDGTKTILKFDGETPEVFKNIKFLTHLEIMQVLSGSEWLHPET